MDDDPMVVDAPLSVLSEAESSRANKKRRETSSEQIATQLPADLPIYRSPISLSSSDV